MAHPICCSECGATFQLSDELYERRFRGRTVTLRCRKCSASFTVDATSDAPSSELSRAVGGGDGTPTVPLAFPGPLGALPWLVSFAEEDDRELDDAGIRAALAEGTIDSSTIVWREGMDEWKPIGEIPSLVAMAPAAAEPAPESAEPSTRRKGDARDRAAPEDDEEAIPVSIEPEPLSSGPSWPDSTGKPGEVKALSGGTLGVAATRHLPAPPPVPGRRAPEPRKAEATGAAAPPAPRARLGSQPDRPPPAPPRRRQESQPEARPADEPPSIASLAPVAPRARPTETAPEELLSLGSGGLLLAPPDASALLAPLEAPPSLEAIEGALDPAAGGESPRRAPRAEADLASPRSSAATGAVAPATRADPPPAAPAGRRLALGAAVLCAVSIVAWLALRGGSESAEGGGAPPSRTAIAPVAAEPTEQVASPSPLAAAPPPTGTELPSVPAASPGPSTPVAPPATAGAGAAGRTPAGAEVAPVSGGPAPPPTAAGASTGSPAAPPGPAPATPPAPATATAESPPAAPPAGAEFDKAAARAALDAAAGAASGCRKEGDPTGVAQVAVTFAPSGRVTSANVSGPPFAGTATGGCIAAALRRARVPAFSGDPVTVGKRVVIQ